MKRKPEHSGVFVLYIEPTNKADKYEKWEFRKNEIVLHPMHGVSLVNIMATLTLDCYKDIQLEMPNSDSITSLVVNKKSITTREWFP